MRKLNDYETIKVSKKYTAKTWVVLNREGSLVENDIEDMETWIEVNRKIKIISWFKSAKTIVIDNR